MLSWFTKKKRDKYYLSYQAKVGNNLNTGATYSWTYSLTEESLDEIREYIKKDLSASAVVITFIIKIQE